MVLQIDSEAKFCHGNSWKDDGWLAGWLAKADADIKVCIEDGLEGTLAAEWNGTTWKHQSKEQLEKGEEPEDEEDGETQLQT